MMATFSSSPRDNYSRQNEKALQDHLVKMFEGFVPDLLVTLTLYEPGTLSDRTIQELRQSSFERLHNEIMNRFDREVHGRKHHRMSAEDKFHYIFRVETLSRYGRLVAQHIHILTQIPFWKRLELLRYKEDFEKVLLKLLWQEGYTPTVNIKEHSMLMSDYIFKRPLGDIQNIFLR